MGGAGLGRIQQIQSFSTVDGPGTRCVVFFQGCPVRCIFCHNPDSWDSASGEEISVEALVQRLERFRSFLPEPGVTISGGEPLAQPDFALELILTLKDRGWHVALDTSGWGSGDSFEKVASAADLVIFSIKHPLHPERVVDCDYRPIEENWRRLSSLKVPVWTRYVLIHGLTDEPEALDALRDWITINPHIERVEILPYNSLAETKWEKIQRDFPLREHAPGVTEEQIIAAEERVFKDKRIPLTK